jgi:hypothetical protein
MKLFKCQNCGQVLYFENRACGRCGRRLGYLPDRETLTALEPAGSGAEGETWTALAAPGRLVRFCANAGYDTCNWLVPEESRDTYCRACVHNAVVPDTSQRQNLEAWRTIEIAKHRLVYTLLQLRLPLRTRREDPAHGLSFEFLADPPNAPGPTVMTGHDNGLITISLAEADDAERERRRTQMGEPYRTLLGHFRHEVGHHYWDLLVRDGGRLDDFRAQFGDEREDYAQALQRHYAQGPPSDWGNRFISAYASSHPWEDFAETFANYLHIVDTLEMARAFGLSVSPHVDDTGVVTANLDVQPEFTREFSRVLEDWLPFTFALNSISRCLGQADLYPFILSPPVTRKLEFVHHLARDARRSAG